ncbi:uncharacterized protein LOC126903883 isoform X4 [Daktulosphaira vitifoliae]|uniref:uncharacterized protein LOC126903883 isoform X4 n=1 Tax=Daktulosphaira vitifoliae TaxID=58002 RepID=UPI0021AAADB6|nr:uncharacterized protein LOC126903883 isoform X4 [Daktulosphaira vitifoliae]
MSSNNFWNNVDNSSSNYQQQSNENSQQNDEWSWGGSDDWGYVDQTKNSKIYNTQQNVDLYGSGNYHSSSPSNQHLSSNSGTSQPTILNNSEQSYDNGIENGHNFTNPNTNWYRNSENLSNSVQSTITNNSYLQNESIGHKKINNVTENEGNFWTDVENSEILPPESFQNDSLQNAMNNLQISNEVRSSKIKENSSKDLRNNYTLENDRPPAGLHRLVTGQTKSFEDCCNSENKDIESYGPQPFDVRTVPGQLSDEDIPVQRHVTGSHLEARSVDNNSNAQNIDSNSVTSNRLPSIEQFQNQFEGHSRQVLHRDFEDFVSQPTNDQKIDDSTKTDIDNSFSSFRSESCFELTEPLTVVKKNRPRDSEVFERTGPDGYMNESSPYIRSTVQQNQKKLVIDSQENNLKLSNSIHHDNSEIYQEYDKSEKHLDKKHAPPPGFHRMVEGNIGESFQKSRPPKNIQKNEERLRRHSIDSDSSLPMTSTMSEDGHKNLKRVVQQKKYSKNIDRHQIRDKRSYRHPRESEEDYNFYEEEEDNVSLSPPELDSDYRLYLRNQNSKRHRLRKPHENYEHMDMEYLSEYDDYDEYERRRRYRSPESDRYRRPPIRHHRDRRYPEDMSHYYRREDINYKRPPSRTDSDYHRRYSPVPFQDYSTHIEMLDPYERKNFLLKFRETNPKAYTEWYANYKTKVEMQKLISRTKNGSECSTPISQPHVHDVASLTLEQEKQREIHRTTPPRYPKYHINAKMNKTIGKLIMLDSSNSTLEVFKVSPDLDNKEAIELFKFPSPFVIGKTHKNVVAQYLNRLVDEASNNSERLLYELICMITKRSGSVDGTDVSELLMENVAKYPSNGVLLDSISSKNDKELTNEPLTSFRDFLLQGNTSEALEFALQSQNWGLAFVLSSFTDLKTFNYVKSKFFQTIPLNDTLQTFFQLNSGKIPSCVTCCSDNSWGDWREHLAMILSNQHVNLNNAYNAVLQLGDTLGTKGDLFGAQFCYITSHMPIEPGMPSKFTLLGTNSNQPFNTMVSNRAILITSAYEFAIRLNQNHFYIPSLLPYKYLLAVRLAEYGEGEYALQHLEAIATQIIVSPSSVYSGFISNVVDLSTDLHYLLTSNLNIAGVIDTLDWLEELKLILSELRKEYNSVNDYIQTPHVDQQKNPTPIINEPTVEHQSLPDTKIDYSISYQAPVIQDPPNVQQPSSVNPYWQPSSISQPLVEPSPQAELTNYYDPSSMLGDVNIHSNQNEMTSEISTISPDMTLTAPVEPENIISTESKFGFFDRQMAELEPKVPNNNENKPSIKKDNDNRRQQKDKNSWLGGLTKFWKPSNNTDSIGNSIGSDATSQQAAPPMDSELNFNPVANSSPATQNQNQFKIQRKRGAKDMYVNVMNNTKQMENITPDSIFQMNQSTAVYNPSQ